MELASKLRGFVERAFLIDREQIIASSLDTDRGAVQALIQLPQEHQDASVISKRNKQYALNIRKFREVRTDGNERINFLLGCVGVISVAYIAGALFTDLW